ncbi:Hydrophobic seed protein [Vigna unguiculata]|uniref:Hydrophobic seed protein n=1 Tax=Vigna unguiculata TaxID=3917 RepID=A0A4D6KIP6_VIGUN|nr:Hydrophobic seed protein [Vigna unguiculata]QCD77260.1 Hydrophobic seed protein [Vigna unguiculata]
MSSKSVAFLLSLNLLLFSALSCDNPPKCVSSPPPVKCPELHVCASILHAPFKPDPKCCPLLGGLIDLDAVVCLCAVLKLDLGIIKVNLDLLINILLNTCGRQPTTFICPP